MTTTAPETEKPAAEGEESNKATEQPTPKKQKTDTEPKAAKNGSAATNGDKKKPASRAKAKDTPKPAEEGVTVSSRTRSRTKTT